MYTPTTSIVLFPSRILMVIYLPYVEKKKEYTMKYEVFEARKCTYR